jgi:hypothetical protein
LGFSKFRGKIPIRMVDRNHIFFQIIIRWLKLYLTYEIVHPSTSIK